MIEAKPLLSDRNIYYYFLFPVQFGELPGYVDYIKGYSISQEGMFFADKSGGTLFTKDGVRMIMLNSTYPLPDDLVVSTAVPGKARTMPTISLEGGYEANFDGVTYQSSKILSWASCCTP